MTRQLRTSHGRASSRLPPTSESHRPRVIAIVVHSTFVLLALVGFGLTFLALELQSGIRAYVAGESLWSKAQKEVVYRLDRFASTGEASELKRAREMLGIPLADRRARMVLEQEPPDREAAAEYFIQGSNHPDDVSKLVWLFLYFRKAPHMRDAVAYWRASDVHILRLEAIAHEMEAYFQAGRMDAGAMEALSHEVSQIAHDLRPLQDGFSEALGRGSRWIGRWLKGGAVVTIGLLAFLSSMVFRWATHRIAESERKFRDTFEQAAMGMAQVLPDGTLVDVNKSLSKLLGDDRDALIGSSIFEFLHPDQDSDQIDHLFAGDNVVHTEECRLQNREGVCLQCQLSVSRVDATWNGQHHMILGIEDVTETRELLDELYYQAHHDALTGTINRRELEKQLAETLHYSGEYGSEHAFCFIDLDQFKVVNDQCGHLAGDEVLQEVTRLLQRELRQSDVLARLGGDEFGVILRNCSKRDASEVAEKIRGVISDYVFRWEDTMVRLGASIGCVSINETTTDVADVLRAADTACRLAKDSGRNRVVPYSPDDHELQSRRSQVESLMHIRAALAAGSFVLRAQEIRPTAEGRGLRCEVLVSMLDSEEREVPPGHFLPAAERYSIAPEIDRWVVETTLETLASYSGQLKHLDACHINLSGQSIGREDFLCFLERALDQTTVNPQQLCFEITETAAVSNLADARHFFQRLHQRGCSFALDDFGSGMSSFGYLSNIPVDIVKIDGAFVHDAHNNELHRAIVESIGDIVSLMGKTAVAEYVESDACRVQVEKLGIEWLQGFAIHRPCRLDDFLRSLHQA